MCLEEDANGVWRVHTALCGAACTRREALTRASDSSRIVAGRSHMHTAYTPTTGPNDAAKAHTQDTGDVGRPHLIPALRLALGLCRGGGLLNRVFGARLLGLRHRLELKQLLQKHGTWMWNLQAGGRKGKGVA